MEAENFFAARDLFAEALKHGDEDVPPAQIYNSLGALQDRITGLGQTSRSLFEKCLELCEGDERLYPLSGRAMSNLILVNVREDRTQEALVIAKSMTISPPQNPTSNDLYGIAAYCYALIRAEQYDLVIEALEPWLERVKLSMLDAQGRERWLVCLHNYASSLDSIGRTAEALEYYRSILRIAPRTSTAREAARIELLQGHVGIALPFLDELYRDFWRFALVREQSQLARNLEFIGIFAHFAGLDELVKRCVEKAELYYGQAYQWLGWVRMREFRSELAGYDTYVSPTDVNEPLWHGLIDYLNLIDGLEAMFPDLYHVARLATAIGRRVFAYCLPEVQSARRLIELSGRLAYVGLTVQTSDRDEAADLIRTADQKAELSTLGARLLDAYPHTHIVRDVVGGIWGQVDNTEYALLSACLRVGFAYIEPIMLDDQTHEQALQMVLTNPPKDVPENVLQSFNQLFQIIENDTGGPHS